MYRAREVTLVTAPFLSISRASLRTRPVYAHTTFPAYPHDHGEEAQPSFLATANVQRRQQARLQPGLSRIPIPLRRRSSRPRSMPGLRKDNPAALQERCAARIASLRTSWRTCARLSQRAKGLHILTHRQVRNSQDARHPRLHREVPRRYNVAESPIKRGLIIETKRNQAVGLTFRNG